MSDILPRNMSKLFRFDKFKYVDIFQKEVSYFLTISETLNVSKAAELLGIQQSGLSRALSRLEIDLGQKLFIRRNNGLSLTEAGQQFLSAIKNTKNNWEENFKSLIQTTENPTGLIKIGLHPSFGQNFLPNIASSLTKKFPQIELEIHALPSLQIIRKISESDLDFGMVASPLKQPEIVTKAIGEDYLAAYQRNLNTVPKYLLFSPETQMSNSILRKLSNLKKIAIKDYELLAKTALETDHMALLPNSVAKNYEGLQQASGAFAKNKISLICHKDKLRSQAYKKVWDEILLSCL